MMSIGIRVSPSEVTFAIYDSGNKTLVNVEKIVVPTAMDWPNCLKYIRSNLLDIIREYDVERAGIRMPEGVAPSGSDERTHIEGVILEGFASSQLKGYFSGAIATIASRIKKGRPDFKSSDFKKLVAGENLLELSDWETLSDKEREAALTAIGAVHV